VLWLALRELVSRRLATGLLALGLLTAALGFVTLAGTARQTTAVLHGDIERAWNTPFDLLVRPPGSVSPLERESGLVRPNYVSGIHGGISVAQLDAIKHMEGVAVAAPIAVLGFVSWPSAFEKSLPAPSRREQVVVYRVRATATGSAGLSRYPVETHYAVVASRGTFQISTHTLRVGGRTLGCFYPTDCYAPVVCGPDGCRRGGFPSTSIARYYLPLQQPIVIAGIDPSAEAAMAGLDRCLVSGRFLSQSDGPSKVGGPDEPIQRIPVLVSNRSFLDESLHMRVDRAPWSELARAGDPTAVSSWTPFATWEASLAKLYRDFLPSLHDYLDPWPVWSAGDVSYRGSGTGRVVVDGQGPNLAVYDKTSGYSEFNIPDELLVPPEAKDVWFRSVVEHRETSPPGPGSPYRAKLWDVVGKYDPGCLRGFDRLAGGRLDIYAAPRVRLADGRVLRPTRSMADYVNSPPLVLTTLTGAAWLANPKRYEGQPGPSFISVVRVKVSGADTPGMPAEARLREVAATIHKRTGLLVDVVKGASPQTLAVSLPAGRFGRPALKVHEGWSKKGVAVRFSRAIDIQGLGFLTVAFVSAVIAVGQTALIAVRRRRQEFAMLRALGWPATAITRLVLGENLVLALVVAGLVSLGALITIAVGRVHLAWWVALAALPLTATVATGAALPSALSASRGTVVRVFEGRAEARLSSLPRGAAGLGLRDLRGPWRFEAVLGVIAIAAGAVLVGIVVLVGSSFSSRLDETALGTFLAGQVRPFHVVVAGLTALVGALAASEVIMLGYFERRMELAVLRAQGWRRGNIVSYVAAQATALALLAALLALAGSAATAAFLDIGLTRWLLSALAGVAVASLCGALALAGPAILAYRGEPATILRGE